jgi:hypothetical protein
VSKYATLRKLRKCAGDELNFPNRFWHVIRSTGISCPISGHQRQSTIRRSYCAASLATTSSCPAHNTRPFSRRSAGRPHEEDPLQSPRLIALCDQLPRSASAGNGARRLATPGLRQHAAPADTPLQVSRSIGRRGGTESHRAVRPGHAKLHLEVLVTVNSGSFAELACDGYH